MNNDCARLMGWHDRRVPASAASCLRALATTLAHFDVATKGLIAAQARNNKEQRNKRPQ